VTSLKVSLEALFQRLFACYGAQHWWPAETTFEVMVGAVLTQNTAWSNVEKAIENLKATCELSCESLLALPSEQLAQAIRPSGYYNLKTERLLNLCRFLKANPGLQDWDDAGLRKGLLSIQGIGPETADDILLYAFERPVFVIDAYTRRLLGRIGLVDGMLAYEQLRSVIEQALRADASYYNEFHALIVIHAKTVCQSQPLCGGCPLDSLCGYERA
jgi:endonuclease-3 related protein